MLFTLVNIARFQHIDPEEALRDMLTKFIYRFNKIEDKAEQTGREISDMTLAEMDEVWESAKET